MKRIITSVLLSITAAFGLAGVAPYGIAAADISANQSAVCQAIQAGADCDKNDNGGKDVNDIIKTVIRILSGLVGVLAVIMIIISGFKYVTAAGDSAKVTSAKHTLVYALVGLIIVALAQVIVKFVLNKAT